MFDGADPSARVFIVEPAQLMVWASRVSPHLDKMADGSGGRYLGNDIMTAIALGRMQLWIVLHGAALICVTVTEIVQYPRRRAMRLIGLVGSNPRLWRHLRLNIERAAKENFGCDLMEAFHVPRFGALLRDYRTTHWFGEKQL